MKLYRFSGTHTLLSDTHGEILLNKHGQLVELDPSRAVIHIAAGAPLEEVIEEKENQADGSSIQ